MGRAIAKPIGLRYGWNDGFRYHSTHPTRAKRTFPDCYPMICRPGQRLLLVSIEDGSQCGSIKDAIGPEVKLVEAGASKAAAGRFRQGAEAFCE